MVFSTVFITGISAWPKSVQMMLSAVGSCRDIVHLSHRASEVLLVLGKHLAQLIATKEDYHR